jgi:LuxR family maltose regulon positive regulatory protein
VAAPVGYGKTTAVRAWCATGADGPAWLTLDVADNDPRRLWRYLATAADRAQPGSGTAALQSLDDPGSPIEHVVDTLMNSVARCGKPLTVVLDDLHSVTDLHCMSSIDHALRHLPANLRLIAVTRVDPPLGLGQLRGRGRLAEVREDDLVFDRAEARELLVVRGRIALDDEEIDLLVKRTEGWPVALVLAGLWLRSVENPADAARRFGGDQRFVAEYLSGEVLGSLGEDRRSFLAGAAVLGEFTAELCDVVLGRDDSASELADLERENLFVARLEGGGWFRMQPLFAEFARAWLDSADPGAASRLHRRAAHWLRSQSWVEGAVAHAAAAGEHELVAEMLVEDHLSMIRNGSARSLGDHVGALPDECVLGHPELAAAAAVATGLVGGRAAEQRRLLGLADQALADQTAEPHGYVETAARVARTLMLEGGVTRAVREGCLAVELAEATSDELLTGACAATARALFFAGTIGRRTPSLVHAHTTLALVALARNRVAQARSHAERAKAAADGGGTTRGWLGANAGVALGAVLAAEGRPGEEERELVAAERMFEDEVPTLHHAWLFALLAQVQIRRGHLDRGETVLRAARDTVDELPDCGTVGALVRDGEEQLEKARAMVRRGENLDRPSVAETAVLDLLAGDLTTREIGDRLCLSPNTVRSHVHALYVKLGVHSRVDAVAHATALGLLSETESPR